MVRRQKLCKAAVDDIYLIWFGVMTWTTYTSYFFIVIGAGSVCAFYFIKLNQYFVNSEIILCFHQRIVSEQLIFSVAINVPNVTFRVTLNMLLQIVEGGLRILRLPTPMDSQDSEPIWHGWVQNSERPPPCYFYSVRNAWLQELF